MLLQNQYTFALENFEGPLDFLLSLIHQEEIDIYEVSIQDIIQQFISRLEEWQNRQIDMGAEFIGTASYLVWLKSKTLLPKQELDSDLPQEEDPRFEIIHHLLEYCQFKQLAKTLAQRHEQQNACFVRGTPPVPEWKKPLGIDHVSLEELSSLFQTMIQKASTAKAQIYEENWRVSDKIAFIKSQLQDQPAFAMEILFSPNSSRIEWITTFLAILELMKMGIIAVGREVETSTLMILKKSVES